MATTHSLETSHKSSADRTLAGLETAAPAAASSTACRHPRGVAARGNAVVTPDATQCLLRFVSSGGQHTATGGHESAAALREATVSPRAARLLLSPRSERARPGAGATAFVLAPSADRAIATATEASSRSAGPMSTPAIGVACERKQRRHVPIPPCWRTECCCSTAIRRHSCPLAHSLRGDGCDRACGRARLRSCCGGRVTSDRGRFVPGDLKAPLRGITMAPGEPLAPA